ncbi:O-methyltransferase-like protein family 3 [Tricladium varicosporioides]|nr:O-methyltransferase-like protein family 3 [Hymenoscyphus varicosporioides]
MAPAWAVNPTTDPKDPRWAVVDSYTFDHLHPSSSTPALSVLDKAVANSNAHNLPKYEVSPSQGKFLMLQARMIGAKNILEIGTLGGYSTIWLANATPETNVTTIEINDYFAGVAKENWEAAGVQEKIEQQYGSALEILPKLLESVKAGNRSLYDMVFIDADKAQGLQYFDFAVKMCRSGAVIFVDNVVMKGSLVDAEQLDNPHVRGSRAVVEGIGKDERVDAVCMQTVGEKIYDGFVMAVVR